MPAGKYPEHLNTFQNIERFQFQSQSPSHLCLFSSANSMESDNSMDFEGDQVIPANELENDQVTGRSSLNPNAQPFVPSAASLLNLNATGATPINQPNPMAPIVPPISSSNNPISSIDQPNNPMAPIVPPISSSNNPISSIDQPNNPMAPTIPPINSIPQSAQFSGPSMVNNYEQSASSSNISAPSVPTVETFEQQFRRFLANSAATCGPFSLLGEIKGMLRIDLEPFDPAKPTADPLNFIRNFERHVEAHKWTDQDTRFQFGNHLAGSANKWFNDQNWRNQDWMQIRTKFLSRFSSQEETTGLDVLFQLNYENDPVKFVESLHEAYTNINNAGDLLSQVISVGFRKLPPYLAQHFAVDPPANFDVFNKRLKKLTTILKPRPPKKAESSTTSQGSPSAQSSKQIKPIPLCPRHLAINQEVRHWLNECPLAGPSAQKRPHSGTSGHPNNKKFKQQHQQHQPQVNLIEHQPQHQQQHQQPQPQYQQQHQPQVNLIEHQPQHQQQHQQHQPQNQQQHQPQVVVSSPANYQLPPHLQPR